MVYKIYKNDNINHLGEEEKPPTKGLTYFYNKSSDNLLLLLAQNEGLFTFSFN